jgi:hypothetical protein
VAPEWVGSKMASQAARQDEPVENWYEMPPSLSSIKPASPFSHRQFFKEQKACPTVKRFLDDFQNRREKIH